MGIINIFQKPKKDDVKKEESLLVPTEPSQESVSTPNSKTLSQPRDSHGRFSSHQKITKQKEVSEESKKPAKEEERVDAKKEEITAKKEEEKDSKEEKRGVVKGPIIVKFFGKEVNKYYLDDKWYFSIDNIVGCAVPSDPPEIKKSANFEKVVREVTKNIDGVPCSDVEGLMAVIKEVIDLFPGPIDRWMKDSSLMEAPLT